MAKLTPQRKGSFWYLIRRVPAAFRHFDKRGLVKITTGVRIADDPRAIRAAEAIRELNARLEQDWADLAAGGEIGQRRRYERARATAANLGLPYIPSQQLAAGPVGEIMRRLELLETAQAGDDARTVEAVAGGVEPPALLISGLVEAFEGEQALALMAYSPDQVRKWRNPKKRAVANLIGVVGDKAVIALTRADALAFRDWWKSRVLEGEVDADTANKEIGHISKMLSTIENAQRLGIAIDAFAKLRLEGEEPGQRTAFDPKFVQDVILKDGAFSGLNAEARRVIYVMADTGLRLSEVVNLLPHHIHLDADVPHVEIVGEGRKLKTRHSARKMPLVGVALAAMKLQPEGFPRYRDKASSLSALANKAFEARDMRPTPEHSLYSLRHSFEDRLTALDPPDKIIAVLMGHKHARPKYGTGPTLKHLQSWLDRIAFTAPASL